MCVTTMLLAFDNTLRDVFGILNFILLRLKVRGKNDEKSPGIKLSDSSLKSQMEQENDEVFNQIYHFLSSNFNSLGKIRQGKR